MNKIPTKIEVKGETYETYQVPTIGTAKILLVSDEIGQAVAQLTQTDDQWKLIAMDRINLENPELAKEIETSLKMAA